MTIPDGLLRIATAPLALPTGMRDLLPPRSNHRRALAQSMLAHFERYGYQLVVPPVVEREEVLVRGLSLRAQRELVRFVEPDTGDVVVLRPDVTPQIARVAATRYRDTPGPLRFMYEGNVMRRPRGRARRHRQIAQAGIECIGWSSVAADVEVMRAATGALAAVGLNDWRLELGHAAIADLLLRDVPAATRDLVTEALAARDGATLSRILGSAFHARSPIAIAMDLAGGVDVLDRADRMLSAAEYRAPLRSLRDALEGIARFDLTTRVLFDLAEVRGLGYYTGVAFQLLAEGPGEPLGAGGRYDTLLERYGSSRPATGCALDLQNVEWALGTAGIIAPPSTKRVLVAGDDTNRSREAERLRATGVVVAESAIASPSELASMALSGGFDRALWIDAGGPHEIDLGPPAAT